MGFLIFDSATTTFNYFSTASSSLFLGCLRQASVFFKVDTTDMGLLFVIMRAIYWHTSLAKF